MKGNFLTSYRTRSTTFAVRTKPTRRPKTAKELALFQSRIATTSHLDNKEMKSITKQINLLYLVTNKAQHPTSGKPKSWGLVVLQGFRTLASLSSGDTKSLRKPSSLATASRQTV